MTSEGLEEVFKGDSADKCARKFLLVSMGGQANDQACADGERGPPSARAEITKHIALTLLFDHKKDYLMNQPNSPTIQSNFPQQIQSNCLNPWEPVLHAIYQALHDASVILL